MGNKSDPETGATAVSPLRIGKREGDGEDEKQVSAKKQKRDEVVEEQKNSMEIVLDDSFSDSQPDMNPEAKKGSPSKKEKKGKPASADCSSSLESLADRSEKDEGNMDIDEGDYSEESDEETQMKKIEVLVDAASDAEKCDLKNVENDSFSDSNNSVAIEKPHMVTDPLKSSENSEQEIDEKASKTPQENRKTLFTPKVRNAGSKTIYTKNLSYSVERTDLENLFKECGEIIDIRLHTYPDGRFKGFGHVEFATAEAAEKALQLHNTEVLRCPIRVGLAREYTRHRSFHVNFSNSFERSERFQCGKGSEISEDCVQVTDEKASKTHQKSAKDMEMAGAASIRKEAATEPRMLHTLEEHNGVSKTIYTRNLSYSVEQTDLENLFKECGEIVGIRLHSHPDGSLKGYGHVEFATAEAAHKALELNNTVLLGRPIGVYIAEQKGKYTCNRSFHVNFSNSFERSERFQRWKDSEISVDCEQETEEKASKTLPKSPKMLVTLEEQNGGSKTIYTKNLSYSVERTDLENLFKECGEIVDIHLHTYPDGRLTGYGHVVFATADAAQKALELNNTVLLGRRILIGIAQEKGEYTSRRSFHVNFSNPFERSSRFQRWKGSEVSVDCEQETEEKALKTNQKSAKDMEMVGAASIRKKAPKMLFAPEEQNSGLKTVYVTNLLYSVERTDLENLLKECGEIVDIRLHTYCDGRLKRSGLVEFATFEAAHKALELNDTVLLGCRIGVRIAEVKGECTSNRSSLSKSFYKSERNQPIRSTERSEYCEEEIEGKASKSPWESVKDVEMVGAFSIEKKASKWLATLMEQNAPSKTIHVKNLSYTVKWADMENLFKECGEIVDIRLHKDNEGRLNGLAHVEFATVEAAKRAFELHNTEFLGRYIRIDWAREKGEYTYSKSNWSNSFQKCGRNQSPTVFVKGFDSSLSEEKIKASLEEHFGSCGEIARISISKFPDSDAFKGFAHLEFKDIDSVKKALYLDQTKLGGYHLVVEKAKPRRDDQGRGGGGHQFGGRDGSGYSSRVGWGSSSGVGWHSSFYN